MPHKPPPPTPPNGGSNGSGFSMIPPRGFEAEKYPLRHRLLYSFGLSAVTSTMNSAYATLIMSSKDIVNLPSTIQVNPHNSNYESDTGPLVHNMSIIDKLTLSIKFNATETWNDKALTSGTAGPNFDDGVYTGNGIHHLRLLWRPIFFSFPEKLDAVDDNTTTSVAAILALTKDSTNEDVVPLTTNKLSVAGASDLSHPISTVYDTQVIGDYNMTTDLTMEDHVWDETLFQDALRRYTNKGALKACVGRTRFVHLTRSKPYQTVFIKKFVPRAVRRIVPYTHMGIQIHVPLVSEIGQDYYKDPLAPSTADIGVKIICNYHEWNVEHDQDRGTPA